MGVVRNQQVWFNEEEVGLVSKSSCRAAPRWAWRWSFTFYPKISMLIPQILPSGGCPVTALAFSSFALFLLWANSHVSRGVGAQFEFDGLEREKGRMPSNRHCSSSFFLGQSAFGRITTDSM